MNPTGTNYSWSNTTQWSQVPSSTQDQIVQNTNNIQAPAPSDNSMNSTSHKPRKDMITRLYRTILGRDPDTAGLNYYLYNTHISELQIARDMFESIEHNEMLMKSKDIREMIRKTEEANKRMNDMEYTLQSLQTLNENYKNLINQKTQSINELRARLGMTNEYEMQEIIPHQSNLHHGHQPYIEESSYNQYQAYSDQPVNQQQYSSSIQNAQDGDYMMLQDPFAEENSQRQGCLGWLKGWLKFS